jgi:hypothetical protein
VGRARAHFILISKNKPKKGQPASIAFLGVSENLPWLFFFKSNESLVSTWEWGKAEAILWISIQSTQQPRKSWQWRYIHPSLYLFTVYIFTLRVCDIISLEKKKTPNTSQSKKWA